jgi:hypothetical protein
LVSLAANVAIMVYEWFIVRTALGLPGLGAAGMVMVDVIISIIVNDAGDLIVRAT